MKKKKSLFPGRRKKEKNFEMKCKYLIFTLSGGPPGVSLAPLKTSYEDSSFFLISSLEKVESLISVKIENLESVDWLAQLNFIGHWENIITNGSPGGPRYSRTFYLPIPLFTLAILIKIPIFQSKMDFLSANSVF